MNKQTAVNWLIKNLMLNGLIRLTQDQHSLYKELTEEAKGMEKEQMFGFTNHHHVIGEGTEKFFKEKFEQYYNETFKSE